MFIKRGDGEILGVVDENELDEDQKKSVKKVSEKVSAQSTELDKAKKQGAK